MTRKVWKKAKDAFIDKWADNSYTLTDIDQFWKDFGTEHNMRVIIETREGDFPVINDVEFKDEKSYAWFILRNA